MVPEHRRGRSCSSRCWRKLCCCGRVGGGGDGGEGGWGAGKGKGVKEGIHAHQEAYVLASYI